MFFFSGSSLYCITTFCSVYDWCNRGTVNSNHKHTGSFFVPNWALLNWATANNMHQLCSGSVIITRQSGRSTENRFFRFSYFIYQHRHICNECILTNMLAWVCCCCIVLLCNSTLFWSTARQQMSLCGTIKALKWTLFYSKHITTLALLYEAVVKDLLLICLLTDHTAPQWYHTSPRSRRPTQITDPCLWLRCGIIDVTAVIKPGLHQSQSSLQKPTVRHGPPVDEERWQLVPQTTLARIEKDPGMKESANDQTAAPAEDNPVCDSQTLSLINQA